MFTGTNKERIARAKLARARTDNHYGLGTFALLSSLFFVSYLVFYA